MSEEKKQPREALMVPVSTDGALQPRNLPEAIELAKIIANSGMVPKQYAGNIGAVLIGIQMGAEVGLAPLASLQNIAVINGRPSLWGDAVKALVIRHPECELFEELPIQEIKNCGRCTVKRRGQKPYTVEFSVEDAKRAGLLGKQGPWTQYKNRMLQMRARGFACRDVFPDVLRGLHVAEEAQDIPTAITAQIVNSEDLPEGVMGFGKKEGEFEPVQELEPVVEPQQQPESQPEQEPQKQEPVRDKLKRVQAATTVQQLIDLQRDDERKSIESAIKTRLREVSETPPHDSKTGEVKEDQADWLE